MVPSFWVQIGIGASILSCALAPSDSARAGVETVTASGRKKCQFAHRNVPLLSWAEAGACLASPRSPHCGLIGPAG